MNGKNMFYSLFVSLGISISCTYSPPPKPVPPLQHPEEYIEGRVIKEGYKPSKQTLLNNGKVEVSADSLDLLVVADNDQEYTLRMSCARLENCQIRTAEELSHLVDTGSLIRFPTGYRSPYRYYSFLYDEGGDVNPDDILIVKRK